MPAVSMTAPPVCLSVCVARYVYKRLRFLGNRYASQFLTLMFLAVWHGYHLGYFVLFFMEFVIILWERKVSDVGELERVGVEQILRSIFGVVLVKRVPGPSVGYVAL